MEDPSKRSGNRVRAGLVLLLTAGVAGACDTLPDESPADAPRAAAPSQAVRWNPLGAWSGHRGRQTESFDVTTGSLRLTWDARHDEAAPARDSAYLRVSLHSAVSGRVLETIADRRGPNAGTVRLAAQPRVAYLLVESNGLEWSITLEEGIPVSAD